MSRLLQQYLRREFGDSKQGRRDYARYLEREAGGLCPWRPRTSHGLLLGGLPRLRDGAPAVPTLELLDARADDEDAPEDDAKAIGRAGGYASVYGSQNSYDEVFEAGAWAQTLEEDWDRLRFLWQHDRALPLGRPERGTTRSDDTGLYWAADVLAFDWARDPMRALRWEIVTGLSVGFWIAEYSIDLEGNELSGGWPIIRIQRARLAEVSAVTWPSDPMATIDLVRQAPVPAASDAPPEYAREEPAPKAPAPTPAPTPAMTRALDGADEILRLLRERRAA